MPKRSRQSKDKTTDTARRTNGVDAATTPAITTHVNTEHAPTFYVSNIEVLVNVYDFRLRLGEVLEASKEKLVIKDLATIFMSPQHALALTAILANRLEDYERQFGKIPRRMTEEKEAPQ